MSSACISVSALEYRDATEAQCLELPSGQIEEAPVAASVIVTGVPEQEVEQRVATTREAAIAETERRLRAEFEGRQHAAQEAVAQALARFAEERGRYFQRVEAEVVHLALAVARKILQREAELDPTLLSALVRIALDRMQSGTSVRVRVVPEEAERWRQLATGAGSAPRWEAIADRSLAPGDCVVETEMGKANFGFEAQLRDIEQSFAQLLAHRPEQN